MVARGLQPLDPVGVSGASRRDAGIDCLQFLMNPSIRLDLPEGSYVAPRRHPKNPCKPWALPTATFLLSLRDA
jgi:hypothetical protein